MRNFPAYIVRGGRQTFRVFLTGSWMIEDGLHDALYGAGLQEEGALPAGIAIPAGIRARARAQARTRARSPFGHFQAPSSSTGSSDDQLIAECNESWPLQERGCNFAQQAVRP